MAVDPRDLLAPNILGQGAHYATVAENAVDFTDEIEVILPDFDDNMRWGPCRWQSRDAIGLPKRGDECLVMFDNRNQPWIVAWWPVWP